MTPEQKARELIDDQLHQTGWAVQSASEMDISAARGVAVREFALDTGFADYLLYGDCQALGTIEAKPEGHTLASPLTMPDRNDRNRHTSDRPRPPSPLEAAQRAVPDCRQRPAYCNPFPSGVQLDGPGRGNARRARSRFGARQPLDRVQLALWAAGRLQWQAKEANANRNAGYALDIINKRAIMPFVVTQPCEGCISTACVDVCPATCFHRGDGILLIDPQECIDCGLCVQACPVGAIFPSLGFLISGLHILI